MALSPGLRGLLSHLPSSSPASLARRLVRHADLARDQRQWLAAAALYEEALALAPSRARIHIQCGHVLKEAGAFDRAEAHYRAALAAFPEDADLQLQVGHFFKTTGRLDAAEAAYARAIGLRPADADARDELERLRPGMREDATSVERPVPELLPHGDDGTAAAQRDGIVMRQLGRELVHQGGLRRVLRGVEGVRGWCVSTRPIVGVTLLVDGRVVAEPAFAAHPLPRPLAPGQAKYVFNHWHDFSGYQPGEHEVELRASDARGLVRAHRAALLVLPDVATPERTASDAWVPAPPAGTPDLDRWVAELPSIVRPARRAPAPADARAVLVQRIDQLGDLVCSEPALRCLRALFPAARLVGLLSPANAELARSFGLFDAIEVVETAEEPGTGRRTLAAPAQAELRARLAAHAFDLAIDLGEGGASRPFLLLSGAPFLYGFRPRDFPWLSAGLEADVRDPLDRLEAASHARRLLALVEGLAALTGQPARIVRRPPPPGLLAAHGLEGRRYAVLHTGARLPFSRWTGYAALAERLLAETDLHLLVMQDAGDTPLALPPSDRVRLLTGRLAFDTFDGLLAGAALFVGNDSGPKHLAALRGVPVVSVHMARLNWSEWGQELTGAIVSRRMPCAGCGIAAHPEECGRDFECLRLIGPDEVFAAVRAELAPEPRSS